MRTATVGKKGRRGRCIECSLHCEHHAEVRILLLNGFCKLDLHFSSEGMDEIADLVI